MDGAATGRYQMPIETATNKQDNPATQSNIMKRHALFVGVNTYTDASIRKLRYSITDASVLADRFKALGYETRLLSDATRTELQTAVLESVTGLGSGDVFLFFFAGHGFTAQDGSHLLFCSDDLQRLLRVNSAGVKVDALEELTNDSGCDRIFMIDACRTDIFAGFDSRGAATRDLAYVSLPDARKHPGTCCVLRSCDKFCPALEIDGLGHGVFTQAILDIVGDSAAHGLPVGDEFVGFLRTRMHSILGKYGIPEDQNPNFKTNGTPFLLFDRGYIRTAPSAPAQPAPGAFGEPSVAKTVKCPICGRRHREDSEDIFECRVCHRDFLCIGHFDKERNVCGDCAGKLAAEEKARAEAERGTQEADRRAREEAERKTREEAERKARAGAERRAREEAEREAKAEGRFAGDTRKVEIAPGVEMEFVWVTPGSFRMGSDDGVPYYNEKPVHRVTLTKGYWLGKFEVTQKEWRSVMGSNPSAFKEKVVDGPGFLGFGEKTHLEDRPSCPVESVSRNDCQEFVKKVNEYLAEHGEGFRVRLPTESEWEFAARGGTKRKGCMYSGSDNIDEVAWYGDNSGGKTHDVGTKSANELGIHDMSGNVCEWCSDWFGGYSSGSVTDPVGPGSGDSRVSRGGGCCSTALDCRSAHRFGFGPYYRGTALGCRSAALNWYRPDYSFISLGVRLAASTILS